MNREEGRALHTRVQPTWKSRNRKNLALEPHRPGFSFRLQTLCSYKQSRTASEDAGSSKYSGAHKGAWRQVFCPEERVGSNRGFGLVLQWQGRADPGRGNLEMGAGLSQRAKLEGPHCLGERQEPFLPPLRLVPEGKVGGAGGGERWDIIPGRLLALTSSRQPHQAASFLPHPHRHLNFADWETKAQGDGIRSPSK